MLAMEQLETLVKEATKKASVIGELLTSGDHVKGVSIRGTVVYMEINPVNILDKLIDAGYADRLISAILGKLLLNRVKSIYPNATDVRLEVDVSKTTIRTSGGFDPHAR